ncbi:hypothetical protein U6A24_18335 [Aquimarina gracilis]|uniref:Uncharacterized protein n=1 Tax=Aquimarina gracilis TaxID=874422 RepID=A0ABU5ZZY0_9FLAO|nr:hypothetical protein [Aquimarina gracilis]MEB3347440.1 hypothetical protein [Aquimarina gracilis]
MKKANAKDSLLQVGKHLSSGVLGMVAGSYVGRHSLVLGVLTIFGGAYYEKDWITTAGATMAFSGMARSKDAQTTQGIDGVKDDMEEAKDRAVTSLKAIGKKLYLDKLSPSLAQKLSLGNIEDRPLVFMGSEMVDQGDFDTQEVDKIIQKIEAGEPLPTADIQQEFIEGTDIEDMGNIDIEALNGAEDITELNAVA